MSTLTIGNTGAAAFSSSTLTISGTDGVDTKMDSVLLDLFTQVPTAPAPTVPANGATGVSVSPTLEWTPGQQSGNFFLEVATDAAFGNVVYSASAAVNSHLVAIVLQPSTQYFWRVRSDNVCGSGTFSATFSFTTRDIPPVLLVDDDDNSPDVQSFYIDTLNALGMDFDLFDTGNSDNEPTAGEMGAYQAVVWFSGDEFGGVAGPGGTSETVLGDYLNAGGCLFLSSQDYFFDRGLTPFMTNFLGITGATSDDNHTVVTGQGSVFGGLGPYTLDFGQSGLSNFSDTVTPGNGGQSAFTGDQAPPGHTATDRVDVRTTFLTFPLPALPTPADREAVLGAFFDNVCPAMLEEIFHVDGFESSLP